MATAAQRLVTELKLDDRLAGFSPSAHTHTIGQVGGLEARLAALEAANARDTLWRDLSASLAYGWEGNLIGRRVGPLVQVAMRVSGAAASGLTIAALPTMFAPSLPSASSVTMRFALDPATGGDDTTGSGEVEWGAITGTSLTVEMIPRTAAMIGSVMFFTTQAWSSTYPGTAF